MYYAILYEPKKIRPRVLHTAAAFDTCVQVVSPAQQEEFFARAAEAEAADEAVARGAAEKGDDGAAAEVAALPTGDFLRFNAAGLQALLAEGCLFGWHVWGAETQLRRVLAASPGGDDIVDCLLIQPSRGPGE